MANSPINIAIFEDHPMMRQALEHNIVRHLPDAHIVYNGVSIGDFTAKISRDLQSTLAILDLDLGDGSEPVDNLATLVAHGLQVIVVSALAKAQLVRLMLKNGAAAFVSKNADPFSLKEAINATITGRQYMSPDIAVALLSDENATVNLSLKEREALSLYASGMKLEAVARTMEISRSTASEYIQRARKKYTKAGVNLPTKTDLYRQAQKDGLIK